MEIRFATNQDITQLKEIWKICFGDSDAYIHEFFQHNFVPEQTVVAARDNLVVGVVYLLPAKLKNKPFMYGYAIGVLPEYRGLGYTQKMLSFVKDESQKKQFLFGLHPANEKLSTFYQKIGLKEMYRLKYVDTSNFANKSTCVFYDINAREFVELRETAYQNLVSWDTKMISYILQETREFGGFAKKIMLNGNTRVLFGVCHDNIVLIKETTMTDDEIKAFSASIKSYFTAEQIFWFLPSWSTLEGEIQTTILGFEDNDSEVYMNLFLD